MVVSELHANIDGYGMRITSAWLDTVRVPTDRSCRTLPSELPIPGAVETIIRSRGKSNTCVVRKRSN
jgi:hypothetical protein